MLRLRQRFFAHIISSSTSTSTSAISPLHRLVAAAAAAAPVSKPRWLLPWRSTRRRLRPHLTSSPQGSKKLSHLKSPAKPDAVLAFLSGLGLSGADAAAVVAKDPLFLCTGVERTLVPVVDGLTGLGLSSPDIARLVSLTPARFRSRSVVSKMHYHLPLFGSLDNILRALRRATYLLSSDLDKVINPNVVFLRECGLADCDIAKLCYRVPRILTTNPEHVRPMAAWAERLGIPRGSGMFSEALHAVAFFSEEKIADKVDFLKKTIKWSDTEVAIAVSKAPMLLRKSKDMLSRRSEFLMSELGLEPAYIARRPVILYYSLEGRLRPRYYVLKFQGKWIGRRDRSFYNVVTRAEKDFVEKFICSHKEAAPHLAEDYAAACKGEVPANFRFT
ncbi:hypothetical protein ZWY2020_015505 [Hordeum vulgare]|nr:hypothetical protein ZWY2020_015505 [Hordeum vulgare]